MNRLIGCSLLSACLAISGCGGGGGGGGGSNSPSQPDIVNTAPVADAGPLQNVKTGDLVVLDGSNSIDADGDSLTYHWQFIAKPLSSSAALTSPNSPKPHFTADQSGHYQLELTVNDGHTNSQGATVSVTATQLNSAPVANPGADMAVTTGEQVSLDGSQSSDADGDSLSYQWAFSNTPSGSLANLVNANTAQPFFTPDIDGEYLLTLIVNDGIVDSSANEIRITASTANSRPTANAGPDQDVITGDTVMLNGTQSQDVDGDPLSYHWGFVSKPTSSTAVLTDTSHPKPSFSADLPGNYVLSLTVNDGYEDSVADNVTITATKPNSPPIASAGENQSVYTGDTVNLNGSGSQDQDGDPLTYQWQLLSRPASSLASISNVAAISPNFTADLAGQYRIGLIVNDGNVDSSMAEMTVTATHPNTAPEADAGLDQSVYTGDTVVLNGSGSLDTDGDPLSYQWHFVSSPEGSTATLSGADNPTPSFTADLAGTYIVELVVDDGEDQSTPDQVHITATKPNTSPVALAGSSQVVIAGDHVTLDGSGSHDIDGDSLAYQWALISSPPLSAAALSDSALVTPSFTADLPGEYILQLTVNDGMASSMDQVTITATPKTYTLSYSAGPGGTLSGDNAQTIEEGNDGSLVTAVPDTGFYFFQWSDGLTDAGRKEENVSGNVMLTAEFKSSLSRPENLIIKPEDGQLTVSWSSVTSATGYNLYYATEPGVTPSNYQDLQGGHQKSTPNNATTLTGLVNGQTYYLVVTATLGTSESEKSLEANGTPAIPIVPWKESLHEGNLDIHITGPKQATVNWQEDTGSTYNLYITQDPNINLDNYAAYGATMVADATPGYSLPRLSIKSTYYVALEENGVFVAWTQFKTGAWGLNGALGDQALAADGTRYISGGFTNVGLSIGGGDAFPIGNSTYPLGLPRANGPVFAVEKDGFGGWYIGGRFTSVDGKPRHNLAHIDSKGVLTNWAPKIEDKPGLISSVSEIAAENSTIYVSGSFSKVNDHERNDFVIFTAYHQTDDGNWFFSGSVHTWNPPVRRANTIAIDKNRVYFGSGNEISAYEKSGRSLSWTASTNGLVASLIVNNGNVYAGGFFTEVNGSPRSKLAALDSNGQLTSWSPNVDGEVVKSLSYTNETLYIGGEFSHVNGKERNNLAALDLNGTLYPWSPSTDGRVYAVSPSSDETIYIAGSFKKTNGSSRLNAAAIDKDGVLSPWQANLGKGYSGWSPYAEALLIQDGTIYIGGNFSQLGLIPRNGLAAFDKDENLSEWNPSPVGGGVSTLTIGNDQVYLGGTFSGINDKERHNLAAVDFDGNVTEWSPSTNNSVRDIKYHDGIIYTAGLFTSANETERNRLAAFNETGALTSWAPEVTGTLVSAIEAKGDRIYVGGNFTKANNQSRKYLTAFDKEGALTDWWPTVNGEVTVLAIDGETIYTGGRFDYAYPEDRNGLAAFDLSGNLTSWNPEITNYAGSNPRAIAIGNNEIYVSGSFDEINGTKLKDCCLASFDFSGKLTNWRPKPDQYALSYSILLGNGKVYLGGDFNEMGGKIRSGMAAFSQDTGTIVDQ